MAQLIDKSASLPELLEVGREPPQELESDKVRSKHNAEVERTMKIKQEIRTANSQS